MKNILFLLLVAGLAATSSSAVAQFSFGVSPGLTFNSAYFGYKTGKVVPYIGFQHAGLSMKSTISSRRFNYSTSEMEDYTDETKASGSLLIPSLGVKFFIINQAKLKAFCNVLISKPILAGKYTYNGSADTLFNDAVGGIALWGGEIGFGVEYFFDTQFSIGGEFGLRPIVGSSTVSEDIQVYNPNTGLNENATSTYTNNVTFSPTYAKLTLNFYFTKKDKASSGE